MFSKFHPNYVIGGTYSGQIVLWDTRAKSLPVLKTPLSAGGHTHPVYSLEMVGTQNAHNLITASTDGFVCSWQLDMLAQPQVLLLFNHRMINMLIHMFLIRIIWNCSTHLITRPTRYQSRAWVSLTTRQPPFGLAPRKAMCIRLDVMIRPAGT